MLQANTKYPSEYNLEVRDSTDALYQKVANVIPEVEWPFYAPLIHEILKLKS